MKLCKCCGKKFKPKLDTQVDCSEACLVNRFDQRVKKTRKLASIYAQTMGYKSMSEVRYAVRMKHYNIPFKYESITMVYQYKPQKYTPDFELENGIILEYKGKLDGPTRKKMLAIKNSNPDKDIRIVLEKPNNRIYAGSKTRYFQWCERHGFIWYDCQDMDKLLNHLNNEKRKKKRGKGIERKTG